MPPDNFKLSVASVISTEVDESSTTVMLVALYLVLKVSKVSVVATGVNAVSYTHLRAHET